VQYPYKIDSVTVDSKVSNNTWSVSGKATSVDKTCVAGDYTAFDTDVAPIAGFEDLGHAQPERLLLLPPDLDLAQDGCLRPHLQRPLRPGPGSFVS
jgi:hypothetical protein